MESIPEIAKESIHCNLCEQCSAIMVFDPEVGKLACPYCGSARAIQTNLGNRHPRRHAPRHRRRLPADSQREPVVIKRYL